MIVILLGPPGAGKGTQAIKIVKEHDIIHISTGDMFRYHMKNDTDLGKQVKSIMASGGLVSDDITLQMVKHRISEPDCKNGFLLDGFPRTINQAEGFDKLSDELNIKIDSVIELNIDENELLGRLSNRRQCIDCGAVYHTVTMPTKVQGICDKCGGKTIQRDDDKPEAIKNRLNVYKDQTLPLIEYYTDKGLLNQVNSGQSSDKVHEDIEEILKGI